VRATTGKVGVPAEASAKAGCRLVCVDPARVHELWPRVTHLIRRALERGGFTDFAEVERDVRAGAALLWLVWDGQAIVAAVVTELRSANRSKFCTIVACGGAQRERWLPLIGELEAFARAEGCAAMKIFGRRGWARALPRYRIKSVVLEKALV